MLSLVNFTKDLKIINAITKEIYFTHLFHMVVIEFILNKDKKSTIKVQSDTHEECKCKIFSK